jgi:hypothetical protein
MDLTELEVTSGMLLEEQKRLRTIEAELAVLRTEIRQDPKRNEKDRTFYALIGMSWTDPGHINREADLKKEREAVVKTISEVQNSVLEGFSSEKLVIPLDPTPMVGPGEFTFRFRSGATFPKSVEELSTMLGIPVPLKIGEVTIYDDRVVVAETDEFFAKKKVVDAFDDMRKAVRRKLTPQHQWM